jgi:tetratricopeptide (TPR) repeat protein
MDKESASFWTDIKKYEDLLAKDPKSYCFTILAELYRKVGLLDDAINVANCGIETHPEYVGGHMAVGRAYFEKGMKEESKKSLERVVRVTPDNLLAQKLLSQIYVEQGDIPSAIKTLQVVELLNPEDAECRLMLESLERTSLTCESTSSAVDIALAAPDESVANDGEFVSSIDEVETDPFEETAGSALLDESIDITSGKDPLATATLAELYVSQGFLDRAINVYRELLEAGPDNETFKERLKELESSFSGVVLQSETQAPVVLFNDTSCVVEAGGEDTLIEVSDSAFGTGGESGLISVLESWLDNIMRGRYATEGDTQKYC